MEEGKWLTIFSSQPLECKLKREKEGKEERTGSKGGREGGNGREKLMGRGKQKLEWCVYKQRRPRMALHHRKQPRTFPPRSLQILLTPGFLDF